jgi:hypothetical protein
VKLETKKAMNWYMAKLVYEVITGEGSQFDEQWRLIRADETNWAYEKACILGRIDGFEFYNERSNKVQWKFLNVVEMIPVNWNDGAQIYSTTEEPTDVETYIHVMNSRAKRAKDLAGQTEMANL